MRNIKETARNDNGYTLVELLVAITVLGLVIPPVFGMFSVSLQFLNAAGRQTEAINLCRLQIEEIRATGPEPFEQSPGDAVQSEETIPGFPGFNRETSVEPFTLTGGGHAGAGPELRLIRVTVSWSSPAGEHSETLESLLYCRRNP